MMKAVKILVLTACAVLSVFLLGPFGPILVILLALYIRHCARYEEDKKLQREANEKIINQEE